jgi:hypothetical protein
VMGCTRMLRSTLREATMASWILPGVEVTLTCHQPAGRGAPGWSKAGAGVWALLVGNLPRSRQLGLGAELGGGGGWAGARAPPMPPPHTTPTRGQAVEEGELEGDVVGEAQGVAHRGEEAGVDHLGEQACGGGEAGGGCGKGVSLLSLTSDDTRPGGDAWAV